MDDTNLRICAKIEANTYLKGHKMYVRIGKWSKSVSKISARMKIDIIKR